MMVNKFMLADVVTVIGTLDVVFGEIDRWACIQTVGVWWREERGGYHLCAHAVWVAWSTMRKTGWRCWAPCRVCFYCASARRLGAAVEHAMHASAAWALLPPICIRL